MTLASLIKVRVMVTFRNFACISAILGYFNKSSTTMMASRPSTIRVLSSDFEIYVTVTIYKNGCVSAIIKPIFTKLS